MLLCKTASQHPLCLCNYTYEDLLFIQVCSDPAPIQYSTGFGKMSSPVFSVALQHRLTASIVSLHLHLVLCKTGSQQALCHYKYTCGDLLFKQVCSESTEMHYNTGLGKVHSPLFSGALQNRLTAGTLSLQFHQWRFALHTGVQ